MSSPLLVSLLVAAGPHPPWVDAARVDDPSRILVCAAGHGRDAAAAQREAKRALGKVVGTRASTQAHVWLADAWIQDPSRAYALVCANRQTSAATLRQLITQADQRITATLRNLETLPPRKQITRLARALATVDLRTPLVASHQELDPNTILPPLPKPRDEIQEKLIAARRTVRVKVPAVDEKASGEHRAYLNTLRDVLATAGYVVLSGGAAADIELSPSTRIESAGQGPGRQADFHFARIVVQIEIKDLAASQILGVFDQNRKEGHRDRVEAERRGYRWAGKMLDPKLIEKLDAALGR